MELKILRQKKAQTLLLLLPAIFFIIALIAFFLFSAPRIDDFIGGKQAAVIRTVGKGEQELSFVDTSARLAAWKSIYDLADNGGFFFDTGDEVGLTPEEYPCDKFVYNLWSSKADTCWPTSDEVEGAYKKHLDRNIKTRYFTQQPAQRLSRVNYDYQLDKDANTNHLVIRGLTNNSVPIKIVYEETVIEEKLISEDTFIEEEPITKCCDGACVVEVADTYYDRYGSGSPSNLPYVWGGETPYNVEQTRKKTKDSESFFYGVSVTPEQPGKGIPTVPGFDCSGFVWWVYKHADMPDFKRVRMAAGGYEDIAKKKGYNQICGSNTGQCTLEDIEKNAEPGDLLFIHNPDHIAIYLGNGQIIDSSSSQNGIDKRPVPESWLQDLKVYRFSYNTGCEETQPDLDATQYFTPEEIAEIKEVIAEDDYNRVMQYDDLIQKAARRYDVPHAFIKAMIMRETRGYSDAVSGREPGCLSGVGLGQFRYTTAINTNFRDVFGSGVTKCGCCGGSYQSSAPIGCTGGHNCPPTDPRLDAEKSINAIAAYIKINREMFREYSDKDAFAIMAYFRGPGATKKSIENTKKALRTDDPSWLDVVKYFDEKSRTEGGSTVENYVQGVLDYYAAFGGGTLSSVSTFKGVKVSFSSRDIGYYYVNPSFTTEVNYDLGIYEGLNAWARQTHQACSGTQKDLTECVEEEKEKHNDAVAAALESLSSSNMMGVGVFNILNLANSNLLFRFNEPSHSLCDGESADYYKFIESFEGCLDHKLPGCYCSMPGGLKFYKMNLSSKRIVLYNETDAIVNVYDFSDKKKFLLKHEGKEIDYIIVYGRGIGKDYTMEYYDNGAQVDRKTNRDNLYFVKNGEELEDLVYNLNELQKCDLKGSRHKFRFCAVSPHKIPKQEDKKLYFKEVAVKFALDLHDPPPPDIDKSNSEDIALTPEKEDELKQTDLLPKEKKCEGLGNAKFKLSTSTKDIKPAYESFISSLVTKLVPQLGVLLFVKNFFVAQNELPALINVELDLNGASEDCDIIGIAYKCGIGVRPLKNGKFDFSNPTGYIDISSRFNANSGFSCSAPDSCISFTNPDGSLIDGKIKCTKPSIDKSADIVSFSISKCTNPIMQYKKMSGLDIITSALSGFGYYFGFAYVDANGNYGRATVESIELPSVMDQLEEQLGLKNILLIKTIVFGNYENVFALLGYGDEFQFVRNAMAAASLDRILYNLKGAALNEVYDEIGRNIRNEDAAEIITDLARDAADGDLDAEYTQILLDELTDGLAEEEIEKAMEELAKAEGAVDNVIDYLDELPDEKKLEVLEAMGENIDDLSEEVYEESEGYIIITGSVTAPVGVGINRAKLDDKWDEVMDSARTNRDKLARLLRALNPEDKLELMQHMVANAPDKMLKVIVDSVSSSKKAEALRNVLEEVTDKEDELARLIANASPEYAKKAALDYFLNQYPEYKDLFNLFEDFGGVTC